MCGGRQSQLRERAEHRPASALVAGHIEFQPDVFGYQHRLDRPVATITLRPECAAILEFDERPQRFRAIVAGTQGSARDIRNIDYRHCALR